MFLGLNLEMWLGYGALALAPIALWFYFLRNNLPRRKGYLVLSFVAGMLSVLPIKLYEAYWDTGVGYLAHTNLFKHLAEVLEISSLNSLLAYIVATVLVMLGLFVFVAVMMFVLEIFSGDNSVRVFRKKAVKVLESPFFFISVGVMCGLMAFVSSLSLHEKVWLFMIVGILEEFTKHLVLRFSDEEKIHSVGEAIQFSIVVALGFAFVENIQYFGKIGDTSLLSGAEFAMLVVLRSLVSVGAHVSFSAILGYFYGVAKFSSEIYQQEVLQHRHRALEWLHRVLHLKGSVLFHEQKMMEGVLLAMVLHGVYNSLLEFGYVSLALLFVGFLLFLVVYLLHQKQLLQQAGSLVRRQNLVVRPG